MSEPVPHAAAVALLARIDRALPFTSVVTTGSEATVWCADVLSRARAGGDPLRPWRDALAAQQERMHGVPVPPHVPAAFVLQWWCEVVATPLAYAVRLWQGVVVPDAGGLGFELAPGLHPHRIVVDPDRLTLLSPVVQDEDATAAPAEAGAALELARTAYHGLVEDVVRGFAPEVVMGSRQRWGVVEDAGRRPRGWPTARPGSPSGPRRNGCRAASSTCCPGCASAPRARRGGRARGRN